MGEGVQRIDRVDPSLKKSMTEGDRAGAYELQSFGMGKCPASVGGESALQLTAFVAMRRTGREA